MHRTVARSKKACRIPTYNPEDKKEEYTAGASRISIKGNDGIAPRRRSKMDNARARARTPEFFLEAHKDFCLSDTAGGICIYTYRKYLVPTPNAPLARHILNAFDRPYGVFVLINTMKR